MWSMLPRKALFTGVYMSSHDGSEDKVLLLAAAVMHSHH